MSLIRRLKRKLLFKLIQLENIRFAAHVRTFRLLRNMILVGESEKRRQEAIDEDRDVDTKTQVSLEQALFTEVGKALSSWASLEEILVGVASLLLTDSVEKAGVVMYSIINFGTWLSIISELFPLSEAHAHLKPRWDKLTGRLRALKDTRDRLAHHSAFESQTPSWLFKVKSIAPSPYDVRSKSKKYKPLTLEQISEFNAAIKDMVRELVALVNEMEALQDAEIAKLEAALDEQYGGKDVLQKAVAAIKPQTE